MPLTKYARQDTVGLIYRCVLSLLNVGCGISLNGASCPVAGIAEYGYLFLPFSAKKARKIDRCPQ